MSVSKYSEIRKIYKTLNKTEVLYSNWAKKNGISYTTLSILYHLEDNNNCSQKDLCQELFLPKQTVNSILSNLVKKGYVKLVKVENKKDKIIEYTKEGLVYSSDILFKLHNIENKVLERMDEEYTSMLIKTNDLYLEYFKEGLENE